LVLKAIGLVKKNTAHIDGDEDETTSSV